MKLTATRIRRKMAAKIGNLEWKGGAGHFLIELRLKAILILIDRLPMVQADVGREAKRPCKKKEEKKRREDDRKRGRALRAAEKSEARTNARASRPQFHAIESVRTKLKTNRFPAPCWHALHLFAARATCGRMNVKKKKPPANHIYTHTKTSAAPNTAPKSVHGVIGLHKRKRRNQATIGWA